MPLNHGWTGAQYSAVRALLGAWLVAHFASLIPWGRELFSSRGVLPVASDSPFSYLFPNVLAVIDAPWFVTALLFSGGVAGLLVLVGFRDRIAAVVAWYVLACLFGRNPLIANPALPCIGWLLLMHALVPTAPYGSLAARGRIDPGGGWTFPRGLYGAAWIVMSVGYSYSGFTKLVSPSWLDGSALVRVLENPLARPGVVRELLLALPASWMKLATWGGLTLELLFAPLALFARARPWIWLAMVGMHLGLLMMVDFAELSAGMLLLHAFTFDPAWLRASNPGRDTVYYDGDCGLCHRTVRLLLAEDPTGRCFTFSPLTGDSFSTQVAASERQALPDSIVVQTADGRLLVRSTAILHVGRRLGGLWLAAASIAALLPRAGLDRLYDGVARIRRRLFAKPAAACPIVPEELRKRFAP